jgi:hypothetical protein
MRALTVLCTLLLASQRKLLIDLYNNRFTRHVRSAYNVLLMQSNQLHWFAWFVL